MSAPTAKIFMHGRSQAVRLPKEFRLPGKECRVRRVGTGILLEPVDVNHRAWLEELRRLARQADEPFMPDGREQPPMPPDDIDLDDNAGSAALEASDTAP